MNMELAYQIESSIRRDVPPFAAQLGDDVVWPRYDGYAIANLPATFAAILGTQMPAPALAPLPADLWRDLGRDVRRIVFVLIDALGYRRFRRALEADSKSGWRPLVERGRFFPLTSVFPSTTVAALSSLWTGLAPSQHGYLGTRLFLREYGALVDMISLKLVVNGVPGQLLTMGLDPDKFLPAPNLAEVLKAAGVAVNDLVMMPTSEARIAYAHLRAGRMQAFRDELARDLAGKLMAVDTREALDAGLWGPEPLHAETGSRLGDLLLLATGDGWLADSTGQMPDFRGMHGGLTVEEMLVPSLWLRLDG